MKRRRIERDWSIKDLARVSGVNDGTLREIESVVADRPIQTTARIAEALECLVHDLLRETAA